MGRQPFITSRPQQMTQSGDRRLFAYEVEMDIYELDAVYEMNDLDYDPLYWEMTFEFGRGLVKRDKVIASNWRSVYLDYIASPVWKAKAFDAREAADNKCQLCNSPKYLQVHHRTYDRLGKEPISDLITLCSDCHSKFHDKGKYDGE